MHRALSLLIYTFHHDLFIPRIKEEALYYSHRYQQKLNKHPIHIIINVLYNSNSTYCLKLHHILDIIRRFVKQLLST